MATRTFSQASLQYLDALSPPPAKRGPGFRTVSVFSYSSSSSDESVEVPEDLNSFEFLLFAGFDDAVAHTIWQAWKNRSTSREDWVIDDARYYIKQKALEMDAIDDEDWDSALRHMGIGNELRLRILNPTYETIRLTQCACYWALDSVNEAFDFLNSLTQRIDKKRAQISHTDSPDEISVVQSATPPEAIEGRTMFYKGGSESCLEKCIEDDGTIKMAALHSTPPTDFHPEKSTYIYLTKHREVALLYARYVEDRVPPAKAAILHIAIANDHIANSREIFGDDWRELVWNLRNIEVHLTTFKQIPARLRHYEEADIIIGQICKDATHKIERMADQSELSVMKLSSGGKASQFVIQSISLQMTMARDLMGFVWVIPTESNKV